MARWVRSGTAALACSLVASAIGCSDSGPAQADSGSTTDGTSAESTSSTGTPADTSTSADESSSTSGIVADTSSESSSSESSTSTGEPLECCGCLCADDHWSCSEDTCLNEDGTVTALAPEAGFFEIDSGDYTVFGQTLTSPRHRVWYSFRPADDAADDRPVLLFFNGGPGSATGPLFGFGTGAYTLDPAVTKNASVAPNPVPWTSFGNLLYVDAPATGFSYPLAVDGAELPVVIDADRDAAAFVRLLLRFLARHPTLQDNPIIIVGESYGGTRSTLILRHLLRYGDLLDGVYRDPELYDEIAAHYTTVFGQADDVPPVEIAGQFGAQVLIQPLVAGYVQFANAQSQPVPGYCMFNGDGYQCDEASGWTFLQMDILAERLVEVDTLSTALGVDATTIAWMHADARQAAYSRADDGFPAPQMDAAFGELAPDDAYYVALNYNVYGQLEGSRDWLADTSGAEFLYNVAFVPTMITNAPFDIVVWSLGMPAVLSYWDEIVSDVAHDTAPQDGVDRPGWLHLTYVDGAVPGATAATIRFPFYPSAGHIVTLREPAELLADIEQWWTE
jgi:hypothetical protein